MNATENFWPDNLLEELPQPPVKLLREIADGLGPKTKQMVLAEVFMDRDRSLELVLRVPALGNYRYGLIQFLRLNNNAEFYPLEVAYSPSKQEGRSIESQEELKDFVARQLASPETKRVIQSLLAQATFASVPA